MVEFDEGQFGHLVAGIPPAFSRLRAEFPGYTVGIGAADGKQFIFAGGLMVGDSRFQHMAQAVEFMIVP